MVTRVPISPPASEVGYTNPAVNVGLPGWGAFASGAIMDPYEDVPQLAWPNSVATYHRMRTDAQIDALIKSVQLPLRRLKYKIKPNGARDEVVSDISQQMGLPVQGDNDEFILTGRQRFNHKEHLRMALLAPLVYGHMPFEQVGDIDAGDLRWKMSKLAPRMPQTIQRFAVAANGDLEAIVQYGTAATMQYADINTGGRRGNVIGYTGTGVPIPATQLAMYAWEVEGGNWAGRSMLRPLYKFWLLKDRMLRVDAIKNEKFGVGIPTATAPQGGDPADYSRMAQAIRASEDGGVGLPNGATIGIEGIKGSLPDTLASIRMYDEQMARSFLAMFLQLGTTAVGSRALADPLLDFFEDGLWGFVEWYCTTTTQNVIWDIVDWNWGEDEQAPELVAEEDDESPLSAVDLANLVRSGALLVDEELQNWIRQRFWMPEYTGADPLPTKPGDISQESTPSGNTPDTATASRPRLTIAGGKPSKGTPKDKRLKENDGATVTNGDRLSVKAHADHDQKNHGNRPKINEPEEGGGGHPGLKNPGEPEVPEPVVPSDDMLLGTTPAPVSNGDGTVTITFAKASSQTVADTRMGHREPNAVEAAAQTDFEKIQKAWQDATASLVEKWKAVRTEQIVQLRAAIEEAAGAGDIVNLAAPDAVILGNDLIKQHMMNMVGQAIQTALEEAKAQGATFPAPVAADLAETVGAHADAVATILGNDLAGAAGRNALLRYSDGVDPTDVGSSVETSLNSLSDSYLNDQLGGALTAAQNTGRMAVIESGGDNVQVYASELLDENTCEACAANDEHEYATLLDANLDYPSGGFADCLGGPRCRGTLVAVYGEGE